MNVAAQDHENVSGTEVCLGKEIVNIVIDAVSVADLVPGHVIVKSAEETVNVQEVVIETRRKKGSDQRTDPERDQKRNGIIVTRIRKRKKRNLILQRLKLKKNLSMVS